MSNNETEIRKITRDLEKGVIDRRAAIRRLVNLGISISGAYATLGYLKTSQESVAQQVSLPKDITDTFQPLVKQHGDALIDILERKEIADLISEIRSTGSGLEKEMKAREFADRFVEDRAKMLEHLHKNGVRVSMRVFERGESAENINILGAKDYRSGIIRTDVDRVNLCVSGGIGICVSVGDDV